MSTVRRLTVALVAAGFLFAAVPSSPAQAATATVTIKAFQFSPSPMRVRVGDIIVWANRDLIAHQIVSDDGAFTKTPILEPGQSARTKMTRAGTIGYHDSLNVSMRGTLVVSAAPPATPRPTARPTAKPTARPTTRPATELTAQATPRATTKPTAKPTAKPTVAPAATSSASAVAVAESSSQSAAPTGNGAAASGSLEAVAATSDVASDSGGMGFLTWITLVGLVGLAFGGGIWFASMRRSVGSNRRGSDRAPVPSAGFALSAPRPPAYELPEYVPGDEPPADHGASAEGDFADDDLLTNPTVRFKDGH